MEALVNNIIKATGWSIFHSLWQGALLYALLVILFLMVPKHSARLKHNIAYITMCLMFAGFCATFFSLFTWPPLQSVSQSLSLNKVVPLSASASSQAEKYFPMLASIYGIGILLQIAVLSTGYYKTWKVKQAEKTAVPAEWQTLFLRISKDLRITKKVGFYLSNYVSVPLVVGFFKPIVLFPMAFATQLDVVHLEAILIHELGHIKRNDYFLNILKTVMETILFFNPFAWLCSNHIQREREHACDDLVLRQTHTPLTYAHALLQIELLKEKHTPVFSMAASGNSQHLYQRIKRITDMKTTYNNAKQQILAVGITILTLISLAWISPVKTEPVVKKKIAINNKIKVNNNVAVEALICTETATALQDTTKKKKAKIAGRIPMAPVAPAPPVAPLKSPKHLTAPPTPPAPPIEPETLARINENIQKHFQSPEWKKHQAEIQKHALVVRDQVNSPEFKKHIAEIQKQSVEMSKQFNSPEWKKQMAEIQKHSIEMTKQFNSPEWKRKMDNINSVYRSEEFKELESKFQKDVEALKLKKEREADKNN